MKESQAIGRSRWIQGVGALAAAAALSGCGGSGGELASRPLARFPSQASLAAIGAKPAPKPALPAMAGDVDQWSIEEAPQADAAEKPWAPRGPWETTFADVAARAARPPRQSLAMACFAREIGRFTLQRKAMPGDTLRRFMAGACGGHVPDLSVWQSTAEAAPEMPDEQLFAQLQAGFRSRLEKALAGGADIAGFWFGRAEGQVAIVVATGDEKAAIKPFSLVPDARGEVTIEGRLDEPAQFFEGYINQGVAGVEPCLPDLAVARPAFRFTCRLADGDQAAWIQLLYAPPQRLLATSFAQVLARRSPDVPPEYVAAKYAEPRTVRTPDEFMRAAVEQLNLARKAARLPAVTLAAAESATAAKLAPHFFAAALGGSEPEQADTIALGLLAGWEVPGMIRSASLVAALEPTLDSGRWLTMALEMPIGRHTLFSPDIEQVALGPLLAPDPGAIGAVVLGYRFHHSADHTGDVSLLLTRVVQARRRMGLAPPLRLGTIAEVMNEELGDVHKGQALPKDALDAVLQRAVERFGTGMRGYVMEVSSLDGLEIPPDVLREPTLHLDIGVTHHKAPGAAWAQYAILVVYAVLDPSST